MTAAEMTTIKIPKPLRERISRDAARSGMTAASYLARLVGEQERRDRFAAVRAAYAGEDDASYAAETAVWDATSADGLDG
jgi:hypothetical protein